VKTLVKAVLVFAFVGVSTAADDLPRLPPIPKIPPDDFFISYKVKDADGDVPDFKFTASASGNASLKREGYKEVTFDIDPKSVKKLYKAVRKSGFFDLFRSPGAGTSSYLRIRVVADGNEQALTLRGYDESECDFISRVVLEVLDENLPGWRGDD
jgi:hypothetical protein